MAVGATRAGVHPVAPAATDQDAGPARDPTRHPSRDRLVVLALLLLVSALSVLAVRPGPALGTDAPPQDFSAARAVSHVEAVVAEPRPVGSPGHARARGHLVGLLEDRGWQVEVQESVGVTDFGEPGTQQLAAVRNVIATRPGTAPTGTVLLAAHYDTVAASPGAADDGLGLAVVLETARALTAGGTAPPRNDLVLLFTDAEEPGLLGAEAFVRERAAGLGPTVVLNHEAAGVTGAPLTFRTTSPNRALLAALAAAPGALADSASEASFDALDHGSDFTHFAAAGLPTYDTAIAGGGAHYHSPLDRPEHLSAASVQRMGEISTALARRFADADLTGTGTAGEDLVTTLPWGLLRYPAAAELPLAAAVLALVVLRVALGRRRGELRLRRTALWAGAALVAVAAAGAAGAGVWWTARLLDPGQASTVLGEPYRPFSYQAAVLLAGLAAAVVPCALRRPGPRAGDPAAGALLSLAAAGVLLAVLLPGTSGAVVLPALPVAVCALGAGLLPARWTAARTLLLLLGTLGAAVQLAPAVWLGFDLGVGTGGPAAAAFLALLVLLTLPVLRLGGVGRPAPAPRLRRRLALPGLLVLLAAGSTAAGLALNREGSTPPRQEQLLYSLDADTGEARWASWNDPRSGWGEEVLGQPRAPLEDAFPAAGRPLPSGPAPSAQLPPPEAEILEDTARGDGRELVLRLRSARAAPAVGLWVGGEGTRVRAATAAGREVPLNGRHGTWDLGFVFEGVPPEGIRVRLVLEQGSGPVRLRVADRSDDLTVVPGFVPPPGGRVLVVPEVWVTRAVPL